MKFKEVLSSIWNEFVYGGHLLSLGAPAILYSAMLIFDVPVSFPLLVLGYGLSQVIYSYNHFKEAEKDALTNPERAQHVKQKKTKILFTLYLFLVIASTVYLRSMAVVLFVLFLVIGGLLFTDVFKGLTKKVIGFKNFYASLFWALLVVLAGLYYGIEAYFVVFLLFLFVFLRFVLSITYFEIKDIESDKKEKLKTFPVVFGKQKTIKILHLLNIVSFLPLVIGVYFNFLPFFSLSLSVFYFYSLYYLVLINSKNINIRSLSYVMVDGEYVLWPLILLLSFINIL